VQAIAVRYDLGSNDSIEAAVKAVVDKWGRIDVFVANAVHWLDFSDFALFHQAPVAKWQPVVRNNIVRRCHPSKLVIIGTF
jgi:NAD(P)-dependent dehydrogenase (short-subunit alcohol dehydrogenase family)